MKVITEPNLRHPVIECGAEQLLVQKGVQSVESGQHQSGFAFNSSLFFDNTIVFTITAVIFVVNIAQHLSIA